MQIEFDSAKREATLAHRGLDFAGAGAVFAGKHLTRVDTRMDYTETRFVTAGWLDARLVILVWTLRGEARRIIN